MTKKMFVLQLWVFPAPLLFSSRIGYVGATSMMKMVKMVKMVKMTKKKRKKRRRMFFFAVLYLLQSVESNLTHAGWALYTNCCAHSNESECLLRHVRGLWL